MIVGLYRLALRAFPKRHRDLYQAEMVDAFQRELEARRGFGAAAVVKFVVAAGIDAIVTGLAERRRRETPRTKSPPP